MTLGHGRVRSETWTQQETDGQNHHYLHHFEVYDLKSYLEPFKTQTLWPIKTCLFMFSRHPSTPSLNTELLSQPFSASRAHPNLISSATSSHFFLGCHMNSNDYKEGLEIVQTINQHYQRTWPRQNVKVVVCYIHPFMCKASKKILTFCLLPTVSLIYRVSHALSEKRIDADISKCCRIRH